MFAPPGVNTCGSCCGVIGTPNGTGDPGAAVNRGYTTSGADPVRKLSCQIFGGMVVSAPPTVNSTLSHPRYVAFIRGPKPFRLTLYPGCGFRTYSCCGPLGP